jgi:hypothetical protein
MSSVFVDVVVDATRQSIKGDFAAVAQGRSNPNDCPVCYGTHGAETEAAKTRTLAENRLRAQQLPQKPRCHAEFFLLSNIRAVRALNGCTVTISQPLSPCVTAFLRQYYSSLYMQQVTEFNPGQTCSDWISGFVQVNNCTVIVQVSGKPDITYR